MEVMDRQGAHAPQSIAVTGATGFIGSPLVRRLLDDGHRVTALTRRAVDLGDARVCIVGDLERAGDLEQAFAGVDVVVHLAARAHVLVEEQGADAQALYHAANVQATERVARAAVATGVQRLVFLSSIKVLGEESGGAPVTDSDTPAPSDDYARSKWEAEQLLWQLAEGSELEVVVVRPPLVYGPGVTANFRRLMALVQRGLPLPLGAVRNRRSMVALDNLLDLLVRCLDAPEAAGKTLLVSDGRDVSTPELIGMIAQAMGRSPRLLPVPERLLRLAGALTGKGDEVARLCGSLQVDDSETRRLLGWEPPVSMDEGVRRAVAAFVASGES